MELMIIYRHVVRIMEEKGIEIVRNWVGTYVTTQECDFDSQSAK